MNGKAGTWIATALLVVLWTSSATADTTPASRELQQEVTALNDNLARISRTLEALLANQRVQLLIRRIELAERRLEPLGDRVNNQQQWIEGLESEIAGLEATREDLEEQSSRLALEGKAPDAGADRMLQELDRRLEQQRQELERVRAKELELSAEYERERDAIAILDERLQELFEEMQ